MPLLLKQQRKAQEIPVKAASQRDGRWVKEAEALALRNRLVLAVGELAAEGEGRGSAAVLGPDAEGDSYS